MQIDFDLSSYEPVTRSQTLNEVRTKLQSDLDTFNKSYSEACGLDQAICQLAAEHALRSRLTAFLDLVDLELQDTVTASLQALDAERTAVEAKLIETLGESAITSPQLKETVEATAGVKAKLDAYERLASFHTNGSRTVNAEAIGRCSQRYHALEATKQPKLISA